ncbi:MAG: glycine reductase [Acidobacteria bacterium]|nr:glycine reductase [Acidobacteriota bacterium]
MAGLDIGSFPIGKILFDQETRLDDDLLRVNRSELQELVLADPRIAEVEIDVVEPGESARVIHVCDAIEPRIKIAGPGVCYPGVLGPVDTVGDGITYRLQGASVVLSAEYPRLIETGTGAPREAILDMSGPGALSPLSHITNLVLAIRLAPGHSLSDYHQAVRMAGFKISHQLAQAAQHQSPPQWNHYELSPVRSELPKVVYIHQMITQLNLPVPYVTWYGTYITDWMPLWIHPNEILDGALLPGALGGYAVKPTSWEHVNNPVIEHLYNAHGTDIQFAGVILHRTRFEIFQEKQLSANQAAQLARLIGAQGAIVSWIGAGNAFIESMLTVQALERRGIKAVFMTYEHGGKEGLEQPLIFSVPEADAIVSVGSLDRPITLPRVERVVGGRDLNVDPEAGDEHLPADGELNLDWRLPVVSAVDHWGFGKQICVEY